MENELLKCQGTEIEGLAVTLAQLILSLTSEITGQLDSGLLGSGKVR